MFDSNPVASSTPVGDNQNKEYPFKKVAEKELSGLKGPIEDILSGTDSGNASELVNQSNNSTGINLKEAPVVPAMQGRSVMANNFNPAPPANVVSYPNPNYAHPPAAKGKFGIIILIILLIIVLGAVGYLAYKYFTGQKNITTQLNSTASNQENPPLNKNLKDLLNIINTNPAPDLENKNNLSTSTNTTTNDANNDNNNDTQLSDTDEDGLPDLQELDLGTNPEKSDSDNDGLTDYEELNVYHTDPINNDSDNDSYLDGEEIKNGYNPLGPGKLTP